MNELNAKIMIDKLKQFFDVKSQKELCKLLNWQESSVSGWITRNSIGAVVENLICTNNFEALKYIFCTDNTINQNISNNTVSGQLAGNNITGSNIAQNQNKFYIDNDEIAALAFSAFTSAKALGKTDELKTYFANAIPHISK